MSGFPDPLEVETPDEMEGWKDMYPPHYIFSEERAEWERRQFWYLDKIHAPDPMYPFDLIFHEAWQIALAQLNTRVFCIPPAQGVAQRILGCYFYICAVEPPSEETIQKKAELFQKRAFYVFENYEKENLYEKWEKRFRGLGEKVKEIEVPDLPTFEPDERVFPEPRGYFTSYDLMEAYSRLIDSIYKAWQYHFQYLNLSYLAYLSFADVVKKLFPAISESAIGKMVAGADVVMFRPQEELAKLARLAVSLGDRVKDILKSDMSPEEKIEELGNFPEGREWLRDFEDAKDPWFYVSCGSGWFHYEGSWVNTLSVPFEYLKSYIETIEAGGSVERDIDEIHKKRDELVREYRNLIKNESDRNAFDQAYDYVRRIYSYAENHLFWVEHWFHTIVFEKMREFGRLFVRYGILNEVDDVFLFNRFEIPMIIEDLVTAWALGENVPPKAEYWKGIAEKRKKILEAARNWTPPPALGTVPEEVAEPFTVMLWGITQDKVSEWIKGVTYRPEDVTEIKGFAASSGVIEGRARVIRFLDEITQLQEGEILVCPNTNPSWAPVFTKIKAAVTDIGGLTSHAAIVCREYGLPSVTGTGVATQVIKTGDIIKVDGDSGTVTIVKRAEN